MATLKAKLFVRQEPPRFGIGATGSARPPVLIAQWALKVATFPVVLLLMPLALAPSVAAQEYPIRPVRITRLDAEANLTFEFINQEENTPEGEPIFSRREEFFRELLTLDADYYLYHPRLLDMRTRIDLGLTQDKTRLLEESARQDGEIIGYDISARLLKEHPLSLSGFLRRNQVVESRGLLRRVDIMSKAEGLSLSIKSKDFPTECFFTESEVTRDEALLFSHTHQRIFGGEVRHVTFPDFLSTLDFTFSSLEETETPKSPEAILFQQAFDSRELNFTNQARFGFEKERKNFYLLTNVRSFEQAGTFDISDLTWRENLRAKISKTLDSFVDFNTSSRKFDTSTIDEIGARGSLTHRLYESLVTTPRIYFDNTEFSNGFRDFHGAGINFAYQKKVPVGKVFLNYGVDSSRTEQAFGAGPVKLIDEAVTLTGIIPVFLANTNVIANSVFVTDTTGTIVYFLNVDYTLTTVGSRTQIQRTGTSSIADGQTVLVDYEFQAPSLKYDLLSQYAGARLSLWDYVDLYYNLQKRDPHILEGEDIGTVEGLTNKVLGASLRLRDLQLRVEAEDFDSTLTPFKSTLAEAQYSRGLSRSVYLNLFGNVSRTKFLLQDTFQDNTQTTWNGTGSISAAISPSTRATGTVSLIEGKGRNNTSIFSLEGAVTSRIRKLELEFKVRQVFFTEQSSEGQDTIATVNVRRKF